MPNIKLKTGEQFALRTLGVDRIEITKIVSDSDIQSLHCQINVEHSYPDGGGAMNHIHAVKYFSNRNRGIETDIDMREYLADCSNVTMEISNTMQLPAFVMTLHYIVVNIEIPVITVYVTNQSNGKTLAIHPASMKSIREKFSKARPAKSVFANADDIQMFEYQHGDLYRPIAFALLNLDPEDYRRVGVVDFVDAISQQSITKIRLDK